MRYRGVDRPRDSLESSPVPPPLRHWRSYLAKLRTHPDGKGTHTHTHIYPETLLDTHANVWRVLYIVDVDFLGTSLQKIGNYILCVSVTRIALITDLFKKTQNL